MVSRAATLTISVGVSVAAARWGHWLGVPTEPFIFLATITCSLVPDQAVAGEDISQPGLIDNNCVAPRIVADYSAKVALGSNVDCAVAGLRANTMNTSGSIEGVGIPSSNIATASVGMNVQKSGRTTGHTTGNIGSINTSVSVQYQPTCGSGRKINFSYTNQVLINSSTFSAGGDSGSLILTTGACPRPVALLFAGSSSTTIGNPIGEVISKMSNALGSTLSFVGMNCTGPGSQFEPQSFQLPKQVLDHASRILEQHRQDLMSKPAVLAVGSERSRIILNQPWWCTLIRRAK